MIDRKALTELKPNGLKAPRLQVLPKIHKNDVPPNIIID